MGREQPFFIIFAKKKTKYAKQYLLPSTELNHTISIDIRVLITACCFISPYYYLILYFVRFSRNCSLRGGIGEMVTCSIGLKDHRQNHKTYIFISYEVERAQLSAQLTVCSAMTHCVLRTAHSKFVVDISRRCRPTTT